MILLSFIMVYPLLYVFFISISDQAQILSGKVMLYPGGLNIGAYFLLMQGDEIVISFINSIIYSVGGTFVYIIGNCIVAYPFLIKKFWLNKPLTVFYIVTMFISGGMIPTYILYSKLGFIDNILVMMIPGAVGVYTIMVFKTNFESLGSELIEAAYMDGANDFFILFKIIIPLSLPIIATFSLFQFIGKWNDFYTPLIFFTERRLYPLTLVLRRLLIQSQVEEYTKLIERNKNMFNGKEISIDSIKNAAIIITIIPILFIYPFVQKYFTKGIMIGSIKG
jgi:putative aldouronate transport system permease protein